ncbi:MAG TPA: RnfABCDGE type electron transport complex subunit B [Polyangia bacterium]|nr:RnfABCDGE type electron transport complex subunit B [Polyangia bacterium]
MLTALTILSGIGLVMAALLAVGRKAFFVVVDERHEKIMALLPGANCGGCGYPGCSGYASALVEGKALPSACPPGGADMAVQIAAVLGVEVGATVDRVAVVACAGDNAASPARARYLGVTDCAAAHAIAGGSKSCTHGCLGLGSCRVACLFDAIEITPGGLAVVIEGRCTGCGKCLATCPRGIIALVPRARRVHVLCNNPDKAKDVKAVCSVGCTGCKLCAKQSMAFAVDGALARIADDEAAIDESAALACPQGSIFDSRTVALRAWLNDPAARAAHEQRAAAWKEAEKERKAAAKKPKAEKPESGGAA